MGRKVKYQYTHFLYPFVVDKNKYSKFLKSFIDNEQSWNLKIHDQSVDNDLYAFFLPYMKKFLFPTLFWDKNVIKMYKNSNANKKVSMLQKMQCITFEHNMSAIKTGKLSVYESEVINFDISNIRIIMFSEGVCFLDIKTEIDEYGKYIDFDKVLDFNNAFRTMTPKYKGVEAKTKLKAKQIDDINDISKFVHNIIKGYENDDLEKIYYDKMFTYSYVCLAESEWQTEEDFEEIKNDFYKFQYVLDSKSSSVFNPNLSKLDENTYSRWQYSMFGFSRESGVVLASEKEKYDITKLPYNFEKIYLYMLLLACYQRISLINFSQELLNEDKSKVEKLQKQLTRFVHFTWFSQITNSEHGMDIWNRWQNAFGLQELFDEVHREYSEYYDLVVTKGQERINILLVIIYVISVLFAGFQIIVQIVDIKNTWIEPFVWSVIGTTVLMYPAYLLLKWLKHKIEKTYRKKNMY